MERRLVAIFAADMVGYSRLMEADETGTLARHKRHRAELIDLKIGDHHGRIVKSTGDGLIAEFPSVVEAVECAVSVQREMEAREADVPEGHKIWYRIAVNLGDVIFDEGDVFGDGVNIAARLEALAQPGGIVVSGTAYDHLKTNIDASYEDLGLQHVKNISTPVRTYRVIPSAESAARLRAAKFARRRAPWSWLAIAAVCLGLIASGLVWLKPWNGTTTDLHSTPASADRPSLAVLPFDNMSGDEEAYFALGLTDDLATDFSQLRELIVIGRESAAKSKESTRDPVRISRELGVRYLIDGSVRHGENNTLRVNIRLIDGHDRGKQVWAERFDGSIEDIFTFQDDVLREIVAALTIRLDPKRLDARREAETRNPRAFDRFLRGWSHFVKRTPVDFAAAAEHFKAAIALDPDYGRAYAALAATYWEGWERWWYKPLGFQEWMGPRREAEKFLNAAMERPTALAHQVASEVYRQEHRHSDMLNEARLAVERDPNDPNSHVALAWALTFDGRHADALSAIDNAIALDPLSPAFYVYVRGVILFSLERYEEAIQLLEKAIALNPANFSPNNFLIASYAQVGQLDKAGERLAWHPIPMSIDWMQYYYVYRESEDWQRFAHGLRLAGAPEIATAAPTPKQLSGESL